ncbi:carbohydrate ABC transporter permease [Micromonospora sp. WMMD1102]|uniref:carbohydrate ABC transporter permease n=1 Tax=Micromonospora sp. WMMD1102 TaxID=3016105 RepID=UPI0024156A1D|nr:carbohydrate ABC transporter permease [Micromonospora sp. WMMD1102]MDG4788663.1 carbohydrate ABC transporter permease [Micromonospora sp. WMMD1102]
MAPVVSEPRPADGAGPPRPRSGRDQRPVWMGEPSRLGIGARGLVLGLGCLAVVVPFWAVLMTSIASPEEIGTAGGFVLWTREPTLDAYQAVLSGGIVTRALVVSAAVTAVGTALSLVATIALAYALSRPASLLHKPILLMTVFTLLFNPGIIPMYLTVKQLGLLDNYLALILPVLVNAFNVIVMRAFFLEIPGELVESAYMDGAGELRILLRIVLPLSKAVVSVIGLFYAVAYWNAFFSAMLYLQSPEKWPLQLVLRTYVVNDTPIGSDQLSSSLENLPPQISVQMAILVISILPILLIYPFIQKHFAKGLMVGAVKG